MKKIDLHILIFFSLITGLLTVSNLYAYPDNIILGGKNIRGGVEFPHDLHMDDYECLDCHHVMEDGENILDESDLEEGDPDVLCSSCHTRESKIETREAFHYQCIKCHDRTRLTPDTTGPTLCGECHLIKSE